MKAKTKKEIKSLSELSGYAEADTLIAIYNQFVRGEVMFTHSRDFVEMSLMPRGIKKLAKIEKEMKKMRGLK